jgi:hypothetical protein
MSLTYDFSGKHLRVDNSTVVGDDNTITGSNNSIKGNRCKVLGNDNIILGDDTIITGNNNKVTGKGTKATGENNFETSPDGNSQRALGPIHVRGNQTMHIGPTFTSAPRAGQSNGLANSYVRIEKMNVTGNARVTFQ